MCTALIDSCVDNLLKKSSTNLVATQNRRQELYTEDHHSTSSVEKMAVSH